MPWQFLRFRSSRSFQKTRSLELISTRFQRVIAIVNNNFIVLSRCVHLTLNRCLVPGLWWSEAGRLGRSIVHEALFWFRPRLCVCDRVKETPELVGFDHLRSLSLDPFFENNLHVVAVPCVLKQSMWTQLYHGMLFSSKTLLQGMHFPSFAVKMGRSHRF
jgi:hypothetical protein